MSVAIQVSLGEAKQILTGRLNEVVINRVPPQANEWITLFKISFGREFEVCRVKVIDSWPLNEGSHCVLFHSPPEAHSPRLLAKGGGKLPDPEAKPSTVEEEAGWDENRGYTDQPALALVDAGEAVDEDTLQKFVKENQTRDDDREAKRRRKYERMTISERAIAVEMAARKSRVDVSREIRLAEKMLGKALEKIERNDRAA